jgi:hypothetical protein
MTLLDIIAIFVIVLQGVIGVAILVGMAIIPGKIAAKRHHPQADAIRITGYVGAVVLPMWLIALVWAYTHPKDSGAAATGIRESEVALKQTLAEVTTRLAAVEKNYQQLAQRVGGAT